MRLLLAIALLTVSAFAHPGVGVVVDKAGNVYYTDLKQVWRMDPRGVRTVAVPNVHTHELHLDAAGSLFGEHVTYSGEQDGSGKYHFRVWRRTPDGRVADVVPLTEGFRKDHSFVRDPAGNSYIAGEGEGEPRRKFVRKIDPQGRSTRLAAGFTNIRWMSFGADGNLYLIDSGNLHRISADGRVSMVTRSLNESGVNPLTWGSPHNLMGLAADAHGNVYVAVHGGNKVKKVSPGGQVTVFHRSAGKWSPTGVAVAGDKVYILEYGGSFEARVRVVPLTPRRS